MAVLLAIVAGVAALGGGAYFSLRRVRLHNRAQYPDPLTLVIEPEADILLKRVDEATIELRWRSSARTVQVYAGTSPELIDRQHIVAQGEGVDHVVVRDLDPAWRWYFELVFDADSKQSRRALAAERELPLKSVVNFRDLGGYVTADGQRVRWGRVYRSGALGELNDEDTAYLQRLGLRLVCDLRSQEEVNRDPDKLPFKPTPHYVHTPLYSGKTTSARWQVLFYNAQQLYDMMIEAYTQHMVDGSAAVFGDLARRMAVQSNLPALVHCTAGKDRTGITSAMLLMLLGVADDLIVADYSLSNAHYAGFSRIVQPSLKKVARLGVTVDDLQPLLTAPPDSMRRVLAYIREHYGTAEAYAKDKAGLSDEEIAALKATLLEPA